MATLPKEIHFEIFQYLEYRHLYAVSQTCRTFAALVKPLLFETLHFRGDAQPKQYYIENRNPFKQVKYPARSRTVEIANLEEAVNEVLNFGVTQYVKRLKFGPRIYLEVGMWTMYREWIEAQIGAETSAWDVGENESDHEEDEEFIYVGLRRLDERRRGRLEKEEPMIQEAEKLWDHKIAEQKLKKDANYAALVRLFKEMPNLKSIEIEPWKVDMRDLGFESHVDDEVGEQFSADTIVWTHLETIAPALHASNRTILELMVPNLDPELCDNSPAYALTALFSHLTTFSFDIEDLHFLTETAPLDDLQEFSELIQAASKSLQHIELRNKYTRHIHLPEIGEHYIEKVLGVIPGGGGDKVIRPLVFPHLKTFKCRTIIFNTPSLTAFLSMQPRLQSVHFERVYLGTPGYKWHDVARALPPSCISLHINHCGHDRHPTGQPAYNHIGEFKPFQRLFPENCGWRISEKGFERYIEGEAKRQVACGLPAPDRGELGRRLRMIMDEAWFERIA